MGEGLPLWVSVSPDVKELPVCLGNPEAIVVACGAAEDCVVRTQHIQLPGNAIEVAAD